MTWNEIEEISEAIQNLILNAHSLGATLSYQAIGSPRHKVQISENVARIFRNESLAELKRDPGDEVIHP
jgi:predicted alpha/beta hydrolase family esterase